MKNNDIHQQIADEAAFVRRIARPQRVVSHKGLPAMSDLLDSAAAALSRNIPKRLDYISADNMLLKRFGCHSSVAHAFAQKVALNVLGARCARVQEVAAHLVAHGSWQSGNPLQLNSIHKKDADHGRRAKND